MAKVMLDVQDVSIYCTCGCVLEQVGNITDIITLRVCYKCAEQIRSEAYNKGLEYGRKAKD